MDGGLLKDNSVVIGIQNGGISIERCFMKYFKFRKKYVMLIFLIVVIIITIFLCLTIKIENKEQQIRVEKKDSWFDEFYIKGNKVYIKCHVTIRNSSNEDNYIKLVANMEDDAKNKLIKNPIVTGQDSKGTDMFFVPGNSQKTYIVFFIEDFAGRDKKQNRNLPEIDIVVNKNED